MDGSPGWPMKSLRRSALLWTTVLLTAVGIIAFGISYEAAQNEAGEFLDGQLRQIALNAGRGVATSIAPPIDQDEEDKFAIDVWDTKTGSVRKAVDGLLPQLSKPGLGTVHFRNEEWRVYLARDEQTTVQVGQRMVVREEIAQTSGIEAAAPILMTVPLAWLVIGFSLSRVLRPLSSLTDAIRRRGADSTEPIPLTDAPVEIIPLLEAMNGLARRLQNALEQQRRFVSDAAHELRTPLAALSIQADNLAACSSAQNSGPVEDMRRGINRSSALVGKLLSMARVESQHSGHPDAQVDVSTVLTNCVADIVPLADSRNISLGLKSRPIGTIAAQADDLKLLFTSVLENAIRYSEGGGCVDVSVGMTDTFAEIEILDSGCGIPEKDLPRVFDRFFRAAPQGIEGTGLGLAIARAVANRYGLQIELANRKDRSGIRATVRIPASRLSFPHSVLRIRC